MDHETGESLECSWDADGWADLNKDTLGSVDVDLELAGLVDRRIEEGKETLMGYIRSGIADVTIHLAHDANMLIRIQQAIFLLALAAWPVAAEAGLVSLETCIREDDDQSLRVFIGGWDRSMLLCHQVRKRWRRCRLGS